MSSKILRTCYLFHKTLSKNSANFKPASTNLQFSTTVQSIKKDDHKTGSTIDQDDLNKFTKQTEYWWDPSGPVKALHSMNEIRVPFVRDGLVQCDLDKRSLTPLKDKKILDIGCGGGILSEALAKIGATVTGIDANKDMIDVAKQHSESNSKLVNKPNYCCTTIEDHVNDHKNFYDGVVASEVIEHVNNQELFVKSCIEVLKPGGRIFFTTLNRTRMTQVFGIWVAEYILNIVPKGTHQYEKFITPNELTFLLERNNCHVEVVYGTMYNVLLNKWDFVSFQTFMYALQAEKLETK
ncbi:ubiquinone biosynthesis O-methyltransferase-like [Ostrinia nubilalis]|uniref:ubiquinone biosynthesis O-methyltransferase-like n=1 Tax=Ostrinia nubilalis TaxID=29057 RepID=UPI0030822889